MMSFGLSPENCTDKVRWPPEGYEFNENKYLSRGGSESGYDQDAVILKSFYPELKGWSSKALVFAWYEFGEVTSWGSTPVPGEREEYFLAFLYANQELKLSHECLDMLDRKWEEYDALHHVSNKGSLDRVVKE